MSIALKCVLISAIGVICSWLGYEAAFNSLPDWEQKCILNKAYAYNPPLRINIAAFIFLISIPIFAISVIIFIITL